MFSVKAIPNISDLLIEMEAKYSGSATCKAQLNPMPTCLMESLLDAVNTIKWHIAVICAAGNGAVRKVNKRAGVEMSTSFKTSSGLVLQETVPPGCLLAHSLTGCNDQERSHHTHITNNCFSTARQAAVC